MLEANLVGIGIGIILSFLTGPVFFALIKTSLEKGFLSGAALASGTLLADTLYVLLTFLGTRQIEVSDRYSVYIGLLGGVFLVVIGGYYLTKKVIVNFDTTEETKLRFKHAGYFLKGFLMTLFNPGVLFFWLTVNSILKTVFKIDSAFDSYQNIVFFTSTLLTLYTVDLTKAYYANKLRTRINNKTLSLMNKIAGIVIIGFGVRLIVHALPTI